MIYVHQKKIFDVEKIKKKESKGMIKENFVDNIKPYRVFCKKSRRQKYYVHFFCKKILRHIFLYRSVSTFFFSFFSFEKFSEEQIFKFKSYAYQQSTDLLSPSRAATSGAFHPQPWQKCRKTFAQTLSELLHFVL